MVVGRWAAAVDGLSNLKNFFASVKTSKCNSEGFMMSNNAESVKKHMVGALDSALKSVGKDLTENDDGMVAKGAGMGALAALGADVGVKAVVAGITAGSVPAVGAAVVSSLAIVGLGAGVGIALAAGIGVKRYWELNRKGKK